MQDLKARLQTWYEETRLKTDEHSQNLAITLATRFPELMGSEVKVTDPQQELHPMQQLVAGSKTQTKFRENAIVVDLLEEASERGFDMDRINDRDYSAADRMQFVQLLGLSLDEYIRLPYVTEESFGAAIEVFFQARSISSV